MLRSQKSTIKMKIVTMGRRLQEPSSDSLLPHPLCCRQLQGPTLWYTPNPTYPLVSVGLAFHTQLMLSNELGPGREDWLEILRFHSERRVFWIFDLHSICNLLSSFSSTKVPGNAKVIVESGTRAFSCRLEESFTRKEGFGGIRYKGM